MSYYQAKYIALRDQIFNEQLATNLMKIEAEHREKENGLKIEAQNNILALNEEVMLRAMKETYSWRARQRILSKGLPL